MLEAVIADDNKDMRMLMKKAVEAAGHKVVGLAEDGEIAAQLVEKFRPQVVFMDIEMPNLDGVGGARKIQDIDPKIFIIFATAHEEFRKEAFEVYAYDYLVKPFEIKRVKETLERIQNLVLGNEMIEPIVKEVSTKKATGKLMLRNKEGVRIIDAREILLIQREERNTVIYAAQDKHVISETLSEIEQRLPEDIFFRCHKSYIINIEKITHIYPYGRWTYIVKLKDTNLDALMTQGRYAALQKLF